MALMGSVCLPSSAKPLFKELLISLKIHPMPCDFETQKCNSSAFLIKGENTLKTLLSLLKQKTKPYFFPWKRLYLVSMISKELYLLQT